MRVDLGAHGALTLPPALLQNLHTVHGDRVDRWLDGLPTLLEEVLDRLEARIVPADPPLSYHLVLFAQRAGGGDIAIKATVPNDEQPSELAAVHALSDAGIGPRLLWSDLDRGVLVMTRVQPGEMLPLSLPSLADDARITRAMATLARCMAGEVDAGPWRDALVPVRRYTRALDTVDRNSTLWRECQAEIERAVALRDAMLAAPDQPPVFLHGDLQHHNVLRDGQAGLAVIDPKGLIGPAGFEFGPLTYNPPFIQQHPDLAALERQRVEIWAEVTGVPRESVRDWGYVAAVLSACWSGQGGAMQWRDAMTIAETLRDL